MFVARGSKDGDADEFRFLSDDASDIPRRPFTHGEIGVFFGAILFFVFDDHVEFNGIDVGRRGGTHGDVDRIVPVDFVSAHAFDGDESFVFTVGEFEQHAAFDTACGLQRHHSRSREDVESDEIVHARGFRVVDFDAELVAPTSFAGGEYFERRIARAVEQLIAGFSSHFGLSVSEDMRDADDVAAGAAIHEEAPDTGV